MLPYGVIPLATDDGRTFDFRQGYKRDTSSEDEHPRFLVAVSSDGAEELVWALAESVFADGGFFFLGYGFVERDAYHDVRYLTPIAYPVTELRRVLQPYMWRLFNDGEVWWGLIAPEDAREWLQLDDTKTIGVATAHASRVTSVLHSHGVREESGLILVSEWPHMTLNLVGAADYPADQLLTTGYCREIVDRLQMRAVV